MYEWVCNFVHPSVSCNKEDREEDIAENNYSVDVAIDGL